MLIDTSVTPYDPDSQFTMKALSQLETSGIPVLSSLDIMKSFQQFLGLSEPTTYTPALVLDSWLRGLSNVPPTWKNLLLIICQLNLDSLAQQIETYLSGGTVKEMRENKAVVVEGE